MKLGVSGESNTLDGAQWRIFVSSTSADLRAEREAVERALHQMREVEFSGMEYFGSRPGKPKEVCLSEVSQCQVYIGLFGARYGSIDPESGKSFTELEYRQARESGIPCLIYLGEESGLGVRSGTVTGEHAGGDPEGAAKLESLKDEMRKEHVVTFFRNPDHLATKVILDLYHLIKDGQLPTVAPQITPTDLRVILASRFDLDEIRTLCFDLGVDFDSLRGEGKAAKARELIIHLQNRRQLDKLISRIKQTRPDIDWS